MKVTDDLVIEFETEQRDFGTQIALHNLLWRVADEQFRDLGVIGISTQYAHADAPVIGRRASSMRRV